MEDITKDLDFDLPTNKLLKLVIEDINTIIKFKKEESKVQMNQQMSFEAASNAYNKVCKMKENKSEILFRISEIRKTLDDLEDEEKKEFKDLEFDKDDLITILEKTVKDLRNPKDNYDSKKPRSPI